MRFSFYLSVTETILHSVYRLGNIVLLFFFKYREMYWYIYIFLARIQSERFMNFTIHLTIITFSFLSFFFFDRLEKLEEEEEETVFPLVSLYVIICVNRCRVPWKYSTPRRSGKVIKFNLLKRSKYINLQFTRKLYIEAVQRVFQRHKEERFLRVFSALRR